MAKKYVMIKPVKLNMKNIFLDKGKVIDELFNNKNAKQIKPKPKRN